MTISHHTSRETGQASPLYIFVVASLLFLALAFFAVGQAGATRNGAQSAADAAALAAAREQRDSFDLTIDDLGDLLDGALIPTLDGCGASHHYAGQNKANVAECRPLDDGRWGSRVSVTSQKPVGDTILPGTDNLTAEATATAIVVPRCSFDPADDDSAPSPGSLDCEGDVMDLDPTDLPDMSDLFDVRLAED
ncbi:pilus assembly protein TadG-related protein [Streptomyces sp. NPDC049837]|uniref:pilus assembly protein TadG-related protein n=1 Tax=Streptomyces sp. NPDC049837 TaxID=3155277 RepID=UPI00344141F2